MATGVRKGEQTRIEVDLLDLSLVTSEYGRQIHPCKGCVSTAMPLCHWPCWIKTKMSKKKSATSHAP
jgi:hypothetical protein